MQCYFHFHVICFFRICDISGSPVLNYLRKIYDLHRFYFKDIRKKYCKDLRDCQTYFPCTFWTGTAHFDIKLIKQCEPEFVFDEARQECVKPTTKEDFDCLFL